MVYRVSNLVSDCSTGRGRLKISGSGKRDAYAAVWDCLCKWIKDQYQRGKGVFIPNFCRLGWEIVPTMAGGNRQAPYFELTDHFLRSHGLPVRRSPKPMQRANEGEINFIKLAIKFSGSLTKDVVFSGSRDLFQRLGRVVASGQHAEFDIGIGKVVAKERKVTCHFDASMRDMVVARHPMSLAGRPLESRRSSIMSRSAPALPTTGQGSYRSPQRPAHRVHSPVTSPAQGYGSPEHYAGGGGGGGGGAQSGFGGVTAGAGGSHRGSVGTGAGAGQMRGVPALPMGGGAPPVPASPGASFYDGEDEDEPASGSLTGKMARGLVTGGDHDREVQWGYQSAHHSQNKVLEEAFARHQQAQLEQAETKARESQETEEAMWQQELENRRRRRIAQQEKRELQEYIKKQMAEQKERQRLERESWKSLAPAPPRSVYGTQEQLERTRDFNSHLDTNLVPQEKHHNGAIIAGPTMYDMDDALRPEVVKAREDLKEGLMHQMQSKHREEQEAKERALDQERRYLEHVRMEAEEQRLFQKMKQQIAKRDLMKAWDRDIQLKNAVRHKEQAGMRHNRRGSSHVAGGVGGALPGAGLEIASGRGLGGGLPPTVSARPRNTSRGFAGSSRRLPGGGGAYQGSAR